MFSTFEETLGALLACEHITKAVVLSVITKTDIKSVSKYSDKLKGLLKTAKTKFEDMRCYVALRIDTLITNLAKRAYDDIIDHLTQKTSELSTQVDQKLTQVDEKSTLVDEKSTQVDEKSTQVDEKLQSLRAQKLQKAAKVEAKHLINEFVTLYEHQDDIDFESIDVLTASNGKPYTELPKALLWELHTMTAGRFKFVHFEDSPSITVHYSWD